MSKSSMDVTISYVRDFSQQAENYKHFKLEEHLILLNRSASLLSTSIQPQHFTPNCLEISKFFVDLHAVIEILNPDSDVLWSCITVLQHCSKNLDCRKTIVNDYRFVPLLAYVLKKTSAQDKVQRLLTIIQDLTYGISITWEEPYLTGLVESLVQIIYAEEENQSQLALSILINLCYKNFPILFLFLRTVNISSFSRKITNHGVLANKMMIILSEDINSPEVKELHVFVRATFGTIDECIKTWNVPYLRHVVEFLLDSKTHKGLHLAMRTYDSYCDDIERLLDQIDGRTGMDDSTEESRKAQQICMSLLFQLIKYVLELSEHKNKDGTESRISLESIIIRIYELLGQWIESDLAGIDAVRLLEILIRTTNKESLIIKIAKDAHLISQLIAISEKPETDCHHTTAILQLILTLLSKQKTEKLILSKITESYFDKMFAPLLTMRPEMFTCSSLAVEILEKSIMCLLLLINFAGIAKKAYFEKVCSLMQMQQFQYALAKAMVSGSELVCDAIFQISQFEYFPKNEVAKLIAQLNTTTVSPKTPYDQWPNLNSILKTNQALVSKDLEERLNALIDLISTANSNSQINNVATSQLIELYNHKMNILKGAESSMNKRLQDASTEITHLSQTVSLQKAELEKYHTMNFKLHINQERLQTQCKDLTHQKDNLKTNITNLMKKLSEQTDALKINEKRLEVKVSEMIVLQKEYNELKSEFEQKTEELERLQTTSKEHTHRIEKLKKTIGAYENDIKEKTRNLEDKDRELAKTQKALEEQKEAKKKSESVISFLETQLQEKNEAIRGYENELLETEEMRKTILSLMESKRPKRKA
ncbi:uncharacterized protein LOC129917071 [Episyrphus balteatus]|uniref:uncharacterized protein LOC129917071 n=1 Tax=Episyrphus balteatus TaxID=286459 RepID=UPI002485D63D|nr:uncharacterized protein LOC129917071 [Episyrphus balteatus]